VLAPEIVIRQEGSRHELEAIARGEAITYGDREFDERFAEARLSGRYELTSRTDVEGELAYTYSWTAIPTPNTPEAASNARRCTISTPAWAPRTGSAASAWASTDR
jgi:hypothetical protein